MTGLVILSQHVPSRTWQWRSRDGEFHYPRQMETRHLFHTLRMVFNHWVEPEHRVGHNVRLYRFGTFYTRDYIRAAVREIGAELFRRVNLTEQQKDELAQMAAYFLVEQQRLAAAPAALEDKS